MKSRLRKHHILRLQQGSCSIEAGFIWADLLTNLERIADHCANIRETMEEDLTLGIHQDLPGRDPDFEGKFAAYSEKYLKQL